MKRFAAIVDNFQLLTIVSKILADIRSQKKRAQHGTVSCDDFELPCLFSI